MAQPHLFREQSDQGLVWGLGRGSPQGLLWLLTSKTQTQASRALYILLNTFKYFKYLGRREWLNH
ncbi:hypothetical protein QP367_23420, partial [Citrobacter sp. UMB8248A]|nr:hypothetical protein [Citrobacter sp. UMB8248A]